MIDAFHLYYLNRSNTHSYKEHIENTLELHKNIMHYNKTNPYHSKVHSFYTESPNLDQLTFDLITSHQKMLENPSEETLQELEDDEDNSSYF